MTKKDWDQVLRRMSALETEVSALRARLEESDPKVYTLEKAAELIHKTPYWLRVACREGRITHYTRMGQTLAFTPEHIRLILADFEGRSYAEARSPLAA